MLMSLPAGAGGLDSRNRAAQARHQAVGPGDPELSRAVQANQQGDGQNPSSRGDSVPQVPDECGREERNTGPDHNWSS